MCADFDFSFLLSHKIPMNSLQNILMLFTVVFIVNLLGCEEHTPPKISVPSTQQTEMPQVNKASIEEFRRLMLTEQYNVILERWDEFEKLIEEDEEVSQESRLVLCHGDFTYLCLMLGLNEKALSYSDEIVQKVQEQNSGYRWAHSALRNSILARLDRLDEIVQECQIVLNEQEAPLDARLHATHTLCLLYTMKGAPTIAASYVEATKSLIELLSTALDNDMTSGPMSKSDLFKLRDYFLLLVQLHEYYLSHLRDTHEYRFIKRKPKPAIRDPDDPEGKQISYEVQFYPPELVSKKDGTPFTYEDMVKEREKLGQTSSEDKE